MKKLKLVSLVSFGLISYSSYAVPAPTTATATAASSQVFSIASNAPLSASLLDNCWKNREDLKNQEIIANYLMTQPSVPSDFAIAWKTARLVYFIGNYGYGEKRFVSSSDGVSLFDYGAKAGKLAQSLNPNAVEGYYWYAIDLGSYGLAKGIFSAASGAKPGMAALNKARSINPAYEWYGSDRILGRYYQELPLIFGGSFSSALMLFTEATTRAPNFKNNWVFLGQYYIKDGDYKKALDACQKALTLPPLDGKFEEMRYTREANECVAKAQSNLS